MKNYNMFIDEEFMESDDSNQYRGGKIKTQKKKTKMKDEFSKKKNKKFNKPKHIEKHYED